MTKASQIDLNKKQADRNAWIFPPEMAMTEERWNQRMAEDSVHKRPSNGHEIAVEHSRPCGIPCERPSCTCGWKGEWKRA